MKKTGLILFLLLSIAINIFLGFNYFSKEDQKTSYKMDDDTRQGVVVKPEHREFVLKEMRGFVESLQQIQQGVLENNPELITNAAQESGTHVMPPKELREALPENFLKMGMGTHKLFDAISESASKNYNPEQTQKQVNELLNRCIACHNTYRFEI